MKYKYLYFILCALLTLWFVDNLFQFFVRVYATFLGGIYLHDYLNQIGSL